MNNKEQKEWSESVLNSMRGAKRIQPNPAILDKIKAELSLATIKPLSPVKKMMLIAAAVIILLINTYALNILVNNESDSKYDSELYSYTLISEFKI